MDAFSSIHCEHRSFRGFSCLTLSHWSKLSEQLWARRRHKLLPHWGGAVDPVVRYDSLGDVFFQLPNVSVLWWLSLLALLILKVIFLTVWSSPALYVKSHEVTFFWCYGNKTELKLTKNIIPEHLICRIHSFIFPRPLCLSTIFSSAWETLKHLKSPPSYS